VLLAGCPPWNAWMITEGDWRRQSTILPRLTAGTSQG